MMSKQPFVNTTFFPAARERLAASAAAESLHIIFQKPAERVQYQGVGFLYPGRFPGGDGYYGIRGFSSAQAGHAGQCYDFYFFSLRDSAGLDNIIGFAACGNSHYGIAPAPKRFYLPRENILICEVIADCRQNRSVGVKGYRWQRLSVLFKTAHEFGGKMIRVSGGAAVSEYQDFAVFFQDAFNCFNGFLYSWSAGVQVFQEHRQFRYVFFQQSHFILPIKSVV